MAEPGVLLIDKTSGPTSHDVVARVRRRLDERRCGHTGTLDPFATGLLVVCVGRATRLARFLTDASKTYEAIVQFGFATDTYDRTGQPVSEPRDVEPEKSELSDRLEVFRGRQLQTPPPFSAKKIRGKRAYELARAGEPVTPEPVEIEIHSCELVALDGARARLWVSVSSGTYIRSIAHDLGEKLGCGAHLAELRRTRIGSLDVSEAIPFDALETIEPVPMLSPEEALRDLPAFVIDGEAAARLVHGHPPELAHVDGGDWGADRLAPGPVRVLGPGQELVAVGVPSPERGVVRPLVVWGAPKPHE